MPLLTLSDLRELKLSLNIEPGDTSEDRNLALLLEWASSWIEELLGRALYKQSRTEYYNGTGTDKLLLRSRPVFCAASTVTAANPDVYVDTSGNFGATSGAFDAGTTQLTYGDDFALMIDQDDGTSRSGILVHLSGTWEKRWARQRGWLSPFIAPTMGSIKVTYTAGWSIDAMPAFLRAATVLLVGKMRDAAARTAAILATAELVDSEDDSFEKLLAHIAQGEQR